MYVAEPRYAPPEFQIRVRDRCHIRGAFERRAQSFARRNATIYSSTTPRPLKLTVDDVLPAMSCLSRCTGAEALVPRMISVISALISNTYMVCGPHKAFALVTSLFLGMAHLSSTSCRMRPLDAATHLALLRLSNVHTKDAVPRKWLAALTEEFTAALVHTGEQNVEVWRSALNTLITVTAESHAQDGGSRQPSDLRAAVPTVLVDRVSSLTAEEEKLMKTNILESTAVKWSAESCAVSGRAVAISFMPFDSGRG